MNEKNYDTKLINLITASNYEIILNIIVIEVLFVLVQIDIVIKKNHHDNIILVLGLHPYIFLLYKQPAKLTFKEPRISNRLCIISITSYWEHKQNY